jgi:hypothetical protein
MEGMDKGLLFAGTLAAGFLAGCASSPPDTTAMGAGPACDLRVDVDSQHRCVVSHVTPLDPQSQLTGEMRQFELQSNPHFVNPR